MNQIIVTRFPHGAAGKFVSTVLQTSYFVDHWNSIVQHQKNVNEFVEEITLEYCNRSFPKNHAHHVKNEPMVPYNTSLYSTTFPRGNNVTPEQYWSQKDARIKYCVDNNLMLNLIFNKSELPLFCKNSKVVTIIATTKEEQEYLDCLLWNKHFIETENEIIYTPNSISHCSINAIPNLLKYKPQWKFDKNQKDKIYNDMIVNNKTKKQYIDKSLFDNNNHDNIFLNLKDIFDHEKFLQEIEKIFDLHNLGSVNYKLISKMHKLWLDRQIWKK